MPLYPSDFLADTSRLTSQQFGIYCRMIMLCWNRTRCNLPNDVDWIADEIVTRKDDEASILADIEFIIDQFWTVKRGHLINPRLHDEWCKAKEKNKRRKNAGKKGGAAKALKNNEKSPSNAKAMLKQPEPEPEPYINTHIHTARVRSNLGGLPMRVYACWNQMAEQNGLEPIRTDIPAVGRGKLVMRAVNDYCAGREELLFEAIANVPLNPHWVGKTEARFRVRLDWLISDPQRLTQALELTPDPMEPSHAKTRHSDKRSDRTDAGAQRSDANDRAAIGALQLLHSKGIV